MKILDNNITWEIYADLTDLSYLYNISHERINEIFRDLCSKKKSPDEAMTILKRRLKEGVK